MTDDKHKYKHALTLFSLVGISFSAPLGRLAITSGADPIAVGIWRMLFSVPIMAIVWIFWLAKNRNSEKKQIDTKSKTANVLSGIFLGFHFICWYLALENTTVFNAAVLVCLQPIYAMIGTYLIYRQKPSKSVILPLFIALFGSIILILPSMGSSESGSLFGNIMAAMAGIFMAAYLMCGKKALQSISLGGYTTISYSVCLALMVAVAIMFKVPMVPNAYAIAICLLLAVAATVLGHSILNWTLPYVGAFFATVVLLGEPVGSSVVAYFMFGTIPKPVEILGGLLILFGITIFILKARRQRV